MGVLSTYCVLISFYIFYFLLPCFQISAQMSDLEASVSEMESRLADLSSGNKQLVSADEVKAVEKQRETVVKVSKTCKIPTDSVGNP